MQLTFTASRNSLIGLNIFYITVSVLLISLGAHLETSNKVSSLPIIGGVIACGVFLLLVSIGGIYCTWKHHQVGLFFYMVILFCLFIVQFSVACACLGVSKTSQEGIALQGWHRLDWKTKEAVQHSYKCCGFDRERGDLNLTESTDPMGHPTCDGIAPCCPANAPKDQCCTTEKNCTCQSCAEGVENVIGEAFRVTGGVSLFFSFTHFIGIWLTLRYRNQRNPLIGGSSSAFL